MQNKNVKCVPLVTVVYGMYESVCCIALHPHFCAVRVQGNAAAINAEIID